ncbi:MAG: hypothetical protein KAI66_14165, partial [Lentisphaeria bacterium]|nr:hypothetical protein [Lentisphaeria bacterium]
MAIGRQFLRTPQGKWVDFRVRCPLGWVPRGTYALIVPLQGVPPGGASGPRAATMHIRCPWEGEAPAELRPFCPL